MESIGEIVIRFDKTGTILEASGKKINIVDGKYGEIWKEEPSGDFFHVDATDVLHDLQSYVDWYKQYLSEGMLHD